MMVHLSNLSAVPALWKLNYVRYPVKKNLVEQTMTLLDKEDQLKTDDQSVFEFQVAEVINTPSYLGHIARTLDHGAHLATCFSVTLPNHFEGDLRPWHRTA
jgi:hypothetical protein